MFKSLIVMPLFNHAATVSGVAREVLRRYAELLVVDDGSTDGGAATLDGLPLTVLRHAANRGKGAAILTAARWARERGFTHLLTIDADGQHFPDEIEILLARGREWPNAIVIGARDFNTPNVPAASRFGRQFSAFWARVQTGRAVGDIQSGLRLYPLTVFAALRLGARRYAFEVEIVIKALWHGFTVSEVPVRVHYPPARERVSHFHQWRDNLRVALLNTRLTARALLPIPHRQFIADGDGQVTALNPCQVVLAQLRRRENPLRLGVSAAWGVFWGSLALPGARQMFLLWGVGWFNLNRLIAFSAEKLALPPLVPALCIEAGHRLRHGEWLTEFSWRTLGWQFFDRCWEWILGSLLVAPALALTVGAAVWVLGKVLRHGVNLVK
ncbi:MAG: glycosyltransferase family 2 protein [Verrucomicrobiales bacterium]|nr:glycosyltransferase family 2 protein [Verrucomicrobiales bacterium]